MKRNFTLLAFALLCSVFISGQVLAIAISPEKSSIDATIDGDGVTQTNLGNTPPPPPDDDGTFRDPTGDIGGDRETPALPVPEPATLILMGLGLAGYRVIRRKK